MNPIDLSATELAEAVRAGSIRPLDAMAASRARIEARNPTLNAITVLNPAVADDAARVAERLAAGEDLPLAGVPVLIKDNIWVKGLSITQGSRLFEGFKAPEDASAVALLREAGALIMGVTTCSEFACKGSTNTPLYGMTRNPIDPSLTPGGSSGGAVAAVASGMVPLAIGTDAGGSSRRPPAHTGLFGFKPTPDVVPYGPGFDEPVWGISSICPIARNIGDIKLAMEVLGGIGSAEAPLRIAFSADFGVGQVLDASVRDVFERAVAALRTSGFDLTETAPDWQGLSGMDIMPLQYAGLAELFGDDWKSAPDRIDPDLAAQIETGLALSGTDVARAHHASHRMAVILARFFETFDAIVTPTTPCPAWPVELSKPDLIGGLPCGGRDHAAFTPQANHGHCPAISVPCGKTPEGLPLGLQIIAAKGRDAEVLALAERIAPVVG